MNGKEILAKAKIVHYNPVKRQGFLRKPSGKLLFFDNHNFLLPIISDKNQIGFISFAGTLKIKEFNPDCQEGDEVFFIQEDNFFVKNWFFVKDYQDIFNLVDNFYL